MTIREFQRLEPILLSYRRTSLAKQNKYQSSLGRDHPDRPSRTNISQSRRGDGRLSTESQAEREPQLSRNRYPAERNRVDARRSNTRSSYAVDEPPTHAPQRAQGQPQRIQGSDSHWAMARAKVYAPPTNLPGNASRLTGRMHQSLLLNPNVRVMANPFHYQYDYFLRTR